MPRAEPKCKCGVIVLGVLQRAPFICGPRDDDVLLRSCQDKIHLEKSVACVYFTLSLSCSLRTVYLPYIRFLEDSVSLRSDELAAPGKSLQKTLPLLWVSAFPKHLCYPGQTNPSIQLFFPLYFLFIYLIFFGASAGEASAAT